MSKNVQVLPATELVEQATQIARIEATNDESRVWGAMNFVYLHEVPNQADWPFFLASSSLLTTPKYNTGTVAVNTGDTAVTFTGATLPTALDGGRIKFNDNPNVYTFTRTGAGTGTISPALSEDKNISGGAYTLYQPIYPLAATFNRFPKNGGLQIWRGGRPDPIPEDAIQTYYTNFAASPTIPKTCRLLAPDTADAVRVELIPGPDKAYVLPYDFLANPPALRESTAGTCTINAGSSSVTFHAGARVAESTTGWYFRVDAFGTGADSEWYRVLALSAANSTVTLQTAFGLSGATSAGYTLCAGLQLPGLLQGAVLHGTVKRLLADQKDSTYVYVDSLQTTAIHDAKRLFKTRTYNQPVETALEDFHFRR